MSVERHACTAAVGGLERKARQAGGRRGGAGRGAAQVDSLFVHSLRSGALCPAGILPPFPPYPYLYPREPSGQWPAVRRPFAALHCAALAGWLVQSFRAGWLADWLTGWLISRPVAPVSPVDEPGTLWLGRWVTRAVRGSMEATTAPRALDTTLLSARALASAACAVDSPSSGSLSRNFHFRARNRSANHSVT